MAEWGMWAVLRWMKIVKGSGVDRGSGGTVDDSRMWMVDV